MTTKTAAPPQADPDARRHRYVLWVLLLVYVLNFLDRQVVVILAEPIKRDLGLSDTQVGLMTGLAFALLYTLLGFPLARFADQPRSNRVGLIAVSLAVWSGFTALCGLSQTFIQLLLARVGVGIGEAGCTPAAHSLISEMVRPEKRASALALYGMGIPIGSLLGLVLGGLLADALGWRHTFFILGVPGVAVALLVWLTIKDPRRRLAPIADPPSPVRLGEVLAELGRSKTFVTIAAAASFIAFLGYGKGVWTTIFFIRSHGLSPGQVGLWLGLGAGLSGVFGTWLGGFLAERFGTRDPRHLLTAPIIGMSISFPFLLAAYSVESWKLSILLVCIPTVFNSLSYGPAFAIIQGVIRPQSRAMAVAVVSFGQSLLGLGLGPLGFGLLSDAVRPLAGADSIRWVLFGAAFMGLIPAFLFWRARRGLSAEMKH